MSSPASPPHRSPTSINSSPTAGAPLAGRPPQPCKSASSPHAGNPRRSIPRNGFHRAYTLIWRRLVGVTLPNRVRCKFDPGIERRGRRDRPAGPDSAAGSSAIAQADTPQGTPRRQTAAPPPRGSSTSDPLRFSRRQRDKPPAPPAALAPSTPASARHGPQPCTARMMRQREQDGEKEPHPDPIPRGHRRPLRLQHGDQQRKEQQADDDGTSDRQQVHAFEFGNAHLTATMHIAKNRCRRPAAGYP